MTYRHIKQMRQRLGLKANDASCDKAIARMTPLKRLELLCGWHIGDGSWASSFLNWAEDVGFKIETTLGTRSTLK
jgi:hypothetical protein